MQLIEASESSQEMYEGLRMGDTGQVKEHFLKDKEEKKRRKIRKREEDSKVEMVLFPALAQVLFMCWGMY